MWVSCIPRQWETLPPVDKILDSIITTCQGRVENPIECIRT